MWCQCRSEGVLQWAPEVVLGLQAAPGRGSSLLEVTLKVKLCFSPNMREGMPGDWTKCGLACVTFSVGLCLACPSLVHRGGAVASSVITQFLTLCLVNGEGSFLICWSTRTGLFEATRSTACEPQGLGMLVAVFAHASGYLAAAALSLIWCAGSEGKRML